MTIVQALRQIRATERQKFTRYCFTTDQAQDILEKAGVVFIDKTTANIDICTTIEKADGGHQ